ncbi:MAG: DUF748 domain-containing protein [Holophaga sp.]|nr:DUF748 domain-containing protein [Holophaga sp.]
MKNLSLHLPRWAFGLLLASGVLVLLYAVAGFLVVPAVLQAKAPAALSRMLGREVRLRKVRLNPFTLTAQVEGFAVKELDGTDFLGWDQLQVELRWSSLVSRTVAFKRIDLVAPFGRVVAERGGRFNYSDLERRLDRPSESHAEPRTLRIDHLAIREARVAFLDRSLAEPFATTLGPLSLELTGFSTGLNSRNPYAFSGRTEAGESFAWNGTFSLEPLASQGRFTVNHLRLPKYHPFYGDQVAFLLQDGSVSAQAGYAFQWSQGTHVMKLLDGSLELLDLKLAQGRGAPQVVLPRAAATGIEADLIARSVRIGALSLQDGRISAVRAGNGEINLVRMLTPKPAKSAEPAAPFHLELKELDLKGFQVALRDLVPVRPVQVLADNLDLNLKDFSLDPAARAQLKLSFRLGGKAGISAEGTVAPLRPALDLKLHIDHLALPPFDPYLAPNLDVRLNRGTLTLDGRLTGAFENRPGDYAAFRGDLRLDRFEAADGARGEPFLGYRALTLAGLDLRTHPDRVSIRSVELVEPDQRLVLAADGSSNVGRALKLEPVSGQSPLGAALPPSPGPPLKLSILRTHLVSGRLSFVDRTLKPNAALLVTGLEGTATSLSTEPDSQSTLDFKGLAGGLAPLRIRGRAMPLRKDQDTDVTVTIQASEMTDFTPYTGKFLGYTVRKGKLDLDAHVQIQKRQLEALVKTRLDQFFLGDKVASPDATRLPVRLGLAILRDRKGVIDLELPVTGSLDDPNLHYGKIIWHAVLNVLTKVVTSPFSLLAKLGGAQDHDLSYVAFPAGSAVPDPVAATKAQALARALAERPELNLEAEGSADPAADAGALKQRALDQLLVRLKHEAGQAGPVAPEERGTWLRTAFRRAFPAPAKAVAPPPPPVAEMEQQLLGSLPVGADDLNQLASARAKALLKLLVDAQVEPGRLFEVTGTTKTPAAKVYFGLR